MSSVGDEQILECCVRQYHVWRIIYQTLSKNSQKMNKFTHEYSKKEIPFLDLKVGIKNCNITTDLYVKYADRQQYLHYTSAHPYHTKKSVVLS